MNVRSIGLNNTAPSASKTQSVKAESNLSKAEQRMIEDQFPQGNNKKLELYMASGTSKTENPDARGNNLDYRV